MELENRKLLSEVTRVHLERVLSADPDNEIIFKEAMAAVDKEIELYKQDSSHQEQIEKLEFEKDKQTYDEQFKKDEAKKDRIIRIIEIGGMIIIAPIVDYFAKKGFAKLVCKFEKEDILTSTPGRSLSGLFRFKK